MKAKSRFIASVIATAQNTQAQLPWARDGRDPRASVTRDEAQSA